MTKSNISFWLVRCIGIGTALGVVVDNIPAGISMGAGCGMLAILLSCLKK